MFLFAWLLALAGCGTTRSSTATEHLLISDAVDATISKIDFSPLTGKKVFLDTAYLKNKPPGPNATFVDADYVVSSIRQQMISDSVILVEKLDDAELVAEPRLGTLGLDSNSITYGIPSGNNLSGASAIVNYPVPSLPELSVGRREVKLGAAKVAVFAYDRKSREPYWQSGIARSSSTARDTWLFGIGPWQHGTIYEGTRFAGAKDTWGGLPSNQVQQRGQGFEEYKNAKLFVSPKSQTERLASAEPSSDALKMSSTSTPAAPNQNALSNNAPSSSPSVVTASATTGDSPTRLPNNPVKPN